MHSVLGVSSASLRQSVSSESEIGGQDATQPRRELRVLEPEGDASTSLSVGRVLGRCLQQTTDCRVDVGAIGEDIGQWRAREAGAEPESPSRGSSSRAW